VNQKQSGSCRCICRKLRIGRSSFNDVTYFSHGFCNIGRLVETALLGLGVSWWSFLEAEFPLDARVTPVVLDLLVYIFSLGNYLRMLYVFLKQGMCRGGMLCVGE
jgi:hypothetical protein